MRKEVWAGLVILALGVIACEPMITIGWDEVLIVFLLLAILIGLPLYHFIRRIEEFRKRNK